MELVSSCRTAVTVRPVATVKQEDLPPPSDMTNRLRRRFREEREARLAADEQVAQLKASLQISQDQVRRLQEENSKLRGPAGHPSIPHAAPVSMSISRPFDQDKDFIFKLQGRQRCKWNGCQNLFAMMRPLIGRYSAYATMAEKLELRRVVVKQFMDSGGRFYEWKPKTEEAVETSFDKALFLTGPLFSNRRAAERSRDESRKSLERIRSSVAETVAKTLVEGASPPATVSLPRPSVDEMVTLLGTYNPDRDYIFSLRGFDSLKDKGHSAFEALARPYREAYLGLNSGAEKGEMRLVLLKLFLESGRRFYKWIAETQEAVQIDLEEAVKVSVKLFGHLYEADRCYKHKPTKVKAEFEKVKAQVDKKHPPDDELWEENDSAEITTWQSTHTGRAERKRRRAGLSEEFPDIPVSNDHDATLSVAPTVNAAEGPTAEV
jgi:hypothetical protein